MSYSSTFITIHLDLCNQAMDIEITQFYLLMNTEESEVQGGEGLV